MALVHCDGFAHYATAQVNDVYSNGPSGATVDIGTHGPRGRSGLRYTGNLAFSLERQSVTTSGAVCIMQGDFRISSAPGSTNILVGPFLGGTVHQCTLDLNADRTLSVHRGSGGSKVQLGSNSTYVVPLDTFIHIGVKFTIANSGGSILVHVWEDGDEAAQVVLNVTNQDTQDGASATWDSWSFGAGTDGNTDWANLVVMDGSGSAANDLLGPVDVWTLRPSMREASALSAWALSAGSAYPPLLDDTTPDDDSTYVSEGTQNDQFTVAVQPVPFPTRDILGAQLYVSTKLTSGSPTVRAIGYDSGTPNLGTTVSPGAAYTYAVKEPYSAMPGGAAFSTAAAFDALQWGVKLTSTATGVRATQLAVALIQRRTLGARNILGGYVHTATGDDHLMAGQSGTVDGAASQAHGKHGTVLGHRTVLVNLDGKTRTLTADETFAVYGQLAGDLLERIGRSVVATAQESISNDTIQDDDELFLSVDAHSVYLVELLGFFTTSTSATVDVKFGFSFPSAATMTYYIHGYDGASTVTTSVSLSTPGLASTSPTQNSRGVISNAVSASSPVHIRGVLVVGATAGTLQFRFAQNVSTGGTPVIREPGSLLSIRRVTP